MVAQSKDWMRRGALSHFLLKEDLIFVGLLFHLFSADAQHFGGEIDPDRLAHFFRMLHERDDLIACAGRAVE